MPENDLILTDDSRTKLDGIVQQMVSNKESDENIQLVVNDFKNKYGVKKKEPLEIGSEVGGQSQIPAPGLQSGYQKIAESGGTPINKKEQGFVMPVSPESKEEGFRTVQEYKLEPIVNASRLINKQASKEDNLKGIYDSALVDTEKWYGAAPSPRKKMASFNEEAAAIKDRYNQIVNSLEDPNNIDKIYDKEISDLNNKYGVKLENGEYKFPDIKAKTDEEYNLLVPEYNERIKAFNNELGNINSKYKKNISDYNASIKRIGDYDKEIQDLASRLGLIIENGEVKVSQGEIDKYQEVYSRKLDERLSRLSAAKRNPYIKDVINKLGAGSSGVLNTPYNVMALSEKAGNALLGLAGVEPSTYWQDFASYLNSNKEQLSANSQRYEDDITTLVQNGDMGAAIGKAGLDIAESLPMLSTLIMGNAAGATKATLGFMGGSKSAEEYMSLNNRNDIGEFYKIIDALGVGLSEIVFEETGTVKILDGIKKGIQERGQNIVRDELGKMLQTNMQRNISLLMQGNSDMIREGVSEAMTQLTDNLIKKATIDPSIDIWDGVTDSAIVGGLIGKGINLSLSAANHVQTKGTRKAVIEAIKQVPQNYSLDAKEKIATLTLEKQAIQERNKDAAKPIQDLVAPQVQAIDEEIKKIAAKEEGIELPVEEKPKEGDKKKPEVKIPKSEVKVSPEGITSLKEEKTTDEPKGKITLTEKVPMSEEDKGSLMLEGENLFTRQINKDGKEFGKITVEEQGDNWKVKDVYVNEERKGYGKEVYRQMNDMAQAEGKTIVSEIPKKNQLQKATYMWESLVELGEARKNNDGSYQMFPSNMIKIVNDLKSGKKTLWHNTAEGDNIIKEGFKIPLIGRVEDIRGVYVGDESTMELMYQYGKEFGEDFLEVEFKPKKPFIVDNYYGNVISEDIDFEKEFNGDAKKIEEYVKNKGYDSFININSSNGNIDEAIAFDTKILNIVGKRKLGDKKTKKVSSPVKEEIVKPKISEEPTNAKGILKDQEQVSPGGDAITEGKGKGGPDLQQSEEAGAKAGDEEGRLARVKNIPPKLTHVEGLGMGMNQAEGVYFSTEKKNRYAKEGKPAKEVIVSVRNPIEFDQQKGDFHKVRTNLLNENKDKFTEADFMEYEVPKKKNISVDDLNDAGVEKLAKIVTDHFKKQGYDSIHFTGEGEGELVVFDKKAWKYKDEVSRDIHNAIVSRVKDYNELPNTHKTKKSSALKDINNLVSKAGYSILQKGQGKIQVLKDGKPIKKITKQRTKEELQSHKALNDYENKEFVDFVNKLVDSGSIVGLYDTGINSKDIPKAIDEIKSGIKSAKSNDLLDYLEQSFEKGEISIWDAGSQVRIPISIKDVLNSITEKETIEDEYVEQVEEIGTVDEIEQFVMDFVDGKITDEELQEYKSKWFSGFPYTEEDFENIANNYRNENNAREKERADENEAVDQNIEAERESKERLQESEIESEVAKKEAAKKKIAEGFDDLMSGLGIMQKAVGEKAPDPLKALKQIAEGVYELGAVNIEEFISKITAELKGRIKNQDDFNKISEYIDKNKGELETLYKEKSKKRKFTERLSADKNVSDEIKEGLSENAKSYIPTSNKVTIHEAEVIIDEKGLEESIHLVRNRKNGLFPRVRVSLAMALITKLNTVIEDKTLSEQVRKEAKTDALAVCEFITEWGTELGQGIQAYAIWSKLNRQTLIDKIVADIEKSIGRKMTPQEYNELTRLAERAKDAPEGFQKFNATTDLLGYEARIKGIKLADLGMSVWYAHILSGYKTQELNFLANMAQTAMELVRSMVYDPKAAAQLLKGLYDGYSRGLLEAWSVLKTGYSPLKEAKYEFSKVQAQPSTLETYEGFKFAGRKWNPLGLHKYVPRVMIATDTLFFYGLKGMRLRELIHRQTYGAGMSKSEVDNYVSEKLFGSKTAKDFALAKIKKEGLKGLDAKRRLWEIMEQDLPDEIHDDINDFASRGTFNYQPEGRIGKMTDLAAKLAEDIKFGNVKPIKFIIPFTNILSNVANTYLDWSPYGFVRAARGRIGGSQDAGTKYTRKYTPEERAKEYIAASIGTLAAFSLMALANMDDDEGKPMIEITANGTGDFKTNYNLQETGWQKYSVKLGNKWYSYQNTPIAVPLTIIGNIMDAKNYQGKSLSDKDFLEKTEVVLWNSVQYFTDLTFLRGISEFMSSFNEKDPNQATSYFEKYMQNITKGFIVPNIVTQTSRKIQSVYDMPMKEAHGMWEQMYRDIPIARNSLNNMINGLGEEVTPNMNRWVNKETYDPIWDMIVSNEAWILKPSKNILIYDENGNGRRLNDEEYYQYAKLRGQILKKKIEANLKDLQGKSKEEVKDFISEASSKAGDQARMELVFGKYSKHKGSSDIPMEEIPQE